MSPDRSDQDPPELSEEELERQRGEDPEETVGHVPDPPADDEPDPGFVPKEGAGEEWRRLGEEIGGERRRPRREDVYPYLLVRAFSPGDRGQRPLWPPTVCWESPDVLLVDDSYTGPFEPSRLVVSPLAGRSYRVFVRAWNLGLFPAAGLHVQAWAVNPGFIGAGNQSDPYYAQHNIGGAWVDLTDRRQAGCSALVELDAPWEIAPDESGHQCLIASLSCPADHFVGPLLVNEHRHVGQRNLTVRGAAQDIGELLGTLANLVPKGFTLELTHGGPAVVPLLKGLGGGTLPVYGGERHVEVVAPALDEIRSGVDIGASVHLLTAVEVDGRTVVARSDALQRVAARTRLGRPSAGRESRAARHPFARAGGTRRVLDQLGPEGWDRVGEVSDQPLGDVLGEGVARALDVGDLGTRSLAEALGGPQDAQHLLRLTLSTPKGELVGGYSIVVSTQDGVS